MDGKLLLRWIAILPVAFVGAAASHFLLHFIIQGTLNSETIQMAADSRAGVERALLPFVAAAAFVAAGVWMAPRHKALVAIVLILLPATLWALYGFGFLSS